MQNAGVILALVISLQDTLRFSGTLKKKYRINHKHYLSAMAPGSAADAAPAPCAPRAPRRKGFIDWANSKSKRIVMEDLIEGTLPLSSKECSPKQAWERLYKNHPVFKKERVMYEQFTDRLRDHRKQVTKKKMSSRKQQEMYEHHQKLFPRQTHNARGELVFDVHPAKLLLREDIVMEKHLTMTPQDLQASRPEYALFKKKKFQERIYQEVRYQKFVNWLNIQREIKGRRRKKKAEEHNDDDADMV